MELAWAIDTLPLDTFDKCSLDAQNVCFKNGKKYLNELSMMSIMT